MDSADSSTSSDDDCFYTNAASRLKVMNSKIKCKPKTEDTPPNNPANVENPTILTENLEEQLVKCCEQIEAETTEIVDSPSPEEQEEEMTESETNNASANFRTSPLICVNDVDEGDSPRRMTRNRSKRKSPRALPAFRNNAQKYQPQPLISVVEPIIDLNDSIERELDQLDDSLNLTQDESSKNDNYILIGSPEAKKSHNEDNYEMSIKVLWKSNKIHRFEMCRNDTFQKIFMHFAALEGVSENQIIISKKDKRINRFDTPGSINARITDIFDGGVVSAEMMKKRNPNEDQEDEEGTCKIKIQTLDKRTLVIKVKHDAPFTSLLQSCSKQLNIPMAKIKFYFDGELVDTDETPESLDIDDEACFDLKILK